MVEERFLGLLCCAIRFKNSKAEDFWRKDFLEGNANA